MSLVYRIALCLSLVMTILTTVARTVSAADPSPTKKVGVLLVNHGSRSATWRDGLLQLERRVSEPILTVPGVRGLKTAFMEYTEPSVATRMKEFDREGYTDIIVVPIFLTVSPHTFDDIPTILGIKEDPHSLQQLKIERIERYAPRARPHLTPPLDFTDILQKNLLRRVAALSQHPEQEGIVLIGYGDETYDREWVTLFNHVATFIRARTGIAGYAYGWCGHIASYKPEETAQAINTVLKGSSKALVIPVLVAHDEMFQIKIIGDGIAKVPNHEERVTYKPDAILPDPEVEAWVIRITEEYAGKIQGRAL